MQVMIEVTNPLAREQTMTKNEDRSKIVAIKELLERDKDFIRSAVQSFVQAAPTTPAGSAISRCRTRNSRTPTGRRDSSRKRVSN